jgi:hypothetical protein
MYACMHVCMYVCMCACSGWDPCKLDVDFDSKLSYRVRCLNEHVLPRLPSRTPITASTATVPQACLYHIQTSLPCLNIPYPTTTPASSHSSSVRGIPVTSIDPWQVYDSGSSHPSRVIQRQTVSGVMGTSAVSHESAKVMEDVSEPSLLGYPAFHMDTTKFCAAADDVPVLVRKY